MDLLIDVLLDSVLDTVKLMPFLLLTYIAMEALEHGMAGRSEALIARADKSGPVVGALLGAVPQCGFSAMAATLYAGRVVSAGTLVAVILSTSDELIPVFAAYGSDIAQLARIIGVKVLIGMAVGLVVDVILRALHRAGDGHPHIAELCERAHCHCGDMEASGGRETHEGHDKSISGLESAGEGPQGPIHVHAGHEHGHDHHHHTHEAHGHGKWWHVIRCACTHTIEVSAFIFAITLVFGLGIEYVGQDVIAGVLSIHPVRATFLAGLIGLIPNCGASVAIAQLFLEGTLATGPMLAGLLVSGGMGLLVLFRTNYDLQQNIEIAAFVYLVGVACGLAASMCGIAL